MKIQIPTYTQMNNSISAVTASDYLEIPAKGGKVKIGYSTDCGNDNTVVGYMAQAAGSWGAVAIGKEANATGSTGTAGTGKCCVAIGGSAAAGNERSIAIGGSSKAQTIRSIAIGQDAQASSSQGYGVAIGGPAKVLGGQSGIAIGQECQTTGSAAGQVAIGYQRVASDTKLTVLGNTRDPAKIYFGEKSLAEIIASAING